MLTTKRSGRRARPARTLTWILASAPALLALGCGPSYYQLRREGQSAMQQSHFALARTYFEHADQKQANRVDNVFDMAECSVALARRQFEDGHPAAALREIDRAVGYYDRVVHAQPGHRAGMKGMNTTLELRGAYEAALSQTRWSADNVGPSAEQQVWLAQEYEERGDHDAALRVFRQAVAMEPRNVAAHVAFADFLARRGNDPAAVAHYQTAYRLDPSNRQVADYLIARQALPPMTMASPAP